MKSRQKALAMSSFEERVLAPKEMGRFGGVLGFLPSIFLRRVQNFEVGSLGSAEVMVRSQVPRREVSSALSICRFKSLTSG